MPTDEEIPYYCHPDCPHRGSCKYEQHEECKEAEDTEEGNDQWAGSFDFGRYPGDGGD